jgi:hypothetical protein
MATSPDGILEASFDAGQNLVRLVVDGGMWPVPGVLRTNRFLNPRAVASGSSWSQGGGTSGANYTADHITGWAQSVVPGVTTARRITLTNAAGVTSLYFRVSPVAATAGTPVIPGMWAGYKAVVETSRAIPFRAFMQFYDAAGTFITTSSPSLYTTAAGVAQEVSIADVVPAGAAFMIPYIGQQNATSGQADGDVWLCSAAIDAQATTQAAVLVLLAQPYFDGDTPSSGSIIRYWTGAPNASSSVEELIAGPVSRVLIERSSPGVPTEPVRTANNAPAAGGWFLGHDDAAPMDTSCTYTVTGLDDYGGVVGTSLVTVDTSGAAWGLWLKAPGRPQLTVQVPLAQVGDVASPTQGGVYQVPGGGSVPQWSGTDTDALSVTLLPRDEGEVARLTALLRAERVLLIQTGDPAEPLMPPGYYFVEGVGRSNPAQVRVDQYGRRVFMLQLTATSAPAGEGQGFTGTTYETVRQTYATYADLLAGNATYFDVLAGEGT